MSSNINPTVGRIKDLSPFRYWCQKVIPLIYDDSLSYYELLSKFVDYINTNIENVEILQNDVTGMYDAFMQLQSYVNTYFENLDINEAVTDGINKKLDKMASDGTLDSIISAVVTDVTEPIVRANLNKSVSDKIDALVDDGVFRSYTSNIVSGWFADYANPVFVHSTSAMTDESKIYVLDTTGYIYAWSGTEFYNTGLQYQFDDSGYLKNAGVLGDNTNLNDVVDVNQCYYLTSSNSYTNTPYGSNVGLLEVRHQGVTTTQIFYSSGTGGLHFRRKTGENPWTEWEGAGLSNNGYLPDNADLNDYLTTGYYLVIDGRTYDNAPVNVTSGLMSVFTVGTFTLQIIYRTLGTIYMRRHTTVSGWDDWKIVNSNYRMLEYNSDLNDLMDDGYWYLNGSTSANYGNMPASLYNRAAFLEIARYNLIVMQKMYGFNGAWYQRRSYDGGSTWSEWILVSNTSGSAQENPPKYLAFGDSLMWGSVWTQGDGSAVIRQASFANQMPTKIANACGMSGNFDNLAQGNLAYVAYSGYPMDYTIGQLIHNTSMSNVGLVTLGGGRNDSSNSLGTAEDVSGSNTIMGAIKSIIEDIQNRNPKTQIVLTQPTPHNHTDGEIAFTETSSGGWSLDSFEVEAKKLCAKYGVGYVGWRECTYMWHWASFTGANGNYAHPNNEESYAQMGAYLGGKVSQFYKF